MMKLPAVSICVPAFRAERYLAETLASVAAQTFEDWELTVTEDGSRDGTEQLVRDFAARVPQTVRYQRHRQNRGLPATRNTGIEQARATWIALLDADDLWLPHHLASLVDTAARTGADLVHAGSQLFDSDSGRHLERRAPSPTQVKEFPRSLLLGHYIIQPASVMLRKALWDRVGGFDPSFRYVEDRDMWLRCARVGARFAYTGEETCLYRKHAAALSKHAGPMAEAAARALDKHLDWELFPASLRRRLTADAWIAAGRIALRSEPGRACGHFRRAMRARRTSARPAAYWLFAAWLALRQRAPRRLTAGAPA